MHLCVGSKEKSVGTRAINEWKVVFLTAIVQVLLGDSEMTGQQVRLWRWVMPGWEAMLDG